MMMIHQHQHPTVEVPPPTPPWDPAFEDAVFSPQTSEYFSALKRYLPSSEESSSCDLPFDSFSCDNFRMYEFKIRKCARGRSHDWTECPYAHPGEKARRRDPRKYQYSGTACPEFRRGSCRKGDSCEFAHGVFECWLHPARYRTQPCKDGAHCNRRVCFFAHSPDQLRVLANIESVESGMKMRFSPTSVFESESPPLSPSELAKAMRGLQVGPRSVWSPRSCSPRGGGGGGGYMGLCCNGNGGSLPTTPTRSGCGCGCGFGGVAPRSGLAMVDVDPWELDEEVPMPMERVESGKDLRAKIYAKLSKDNSLDPIPNPDPECIPDFQWVSDLLQ